MRVIDLVNNTYRSKSILHGAVPQSEGRVYTITQMGVETNINGYQVSLDYPTSNPNQPANVYTFAYHADDNTLYFYDPATQQWLQERIGADNAFNLRKTAAYAQKLNVELANNAGGGQLGQPAADAPVDLSAPVDADVVVDAAPPAMPEYDQPECPTDGYLWQPGYWAYSPYRTDYYWVPGAWVAPPTVGVLWTPPYWGYEGNRYVFHIGYWGDHVGFYGGINYGYGYGGRGYYGGEWRGSQFNYNTAVVRVNTTVVRNTYVNRTVINVVVNNHSSFNGHGGVNATPTSEEIAASREHHLKPTPEQNGNQLQARSNPNQFNKTNPGGKPVFASPKAAPYQPKANPGIKGGNNLKQPITPMKPKDPSKPDGLQGGPVKPQNPAANPVKPQGAQANPAKPDGLPGAPNKAQPSAPVKPQVKPTPAKPDGLPGAPNKPQAQPVNPAKPQVQPAVPSKPGGLPGSTPGKTTPPAKTKNTKPKPKVTPPAPTQLPKQ